MCLIKALQSQRRGSRDPGISETDFSAALDDGFWLLTIVVNNCLEYDGFSRSDFESVSLF